MCDLYGLRSSDSRFSFAIVILDQTRHLASIASPAILPLPAQHRPEYRRVVSWLALGRPFSGAVLVPGYKRDKRWESGRVQFEFFCELISRRVQFEFL